MSHHTDRHTMKPEGDHDMDLEQVDRESARLSPWAHVATVGADGDPDVVPVHPAWEGDTLWFMDRRRRASRPTTSPIQPNVAMHWQVTEAGDGIEVWGSATVHDRRRDEEAACGPACSTTTSTCSRPAGPRDLPGPAFVAVQPERALYLIAYGMGGRETWSA